ncbi:MULTISPECIES: hypothetical protein [Staphylococcus]|uniref:Mobilization protein n=1 Tax=Staphylococcus hsinchuensis TaxID=3051183 RepID=A0ABZ3EE89_9STAP|nr:hypothetical protein [Staphylococcus sp. Marseille-Q6910]
MENKLLDLVILISMFSFFLVSIIDNHNFILLVLAISYILIWVLIHTFTKNNKPHKDK